MFIFLQTQKNQYQTINMFNKTIDILYRLEKLTKLEKSQLGALNDLKKQAKAINPRYMPYYVDDKYAQEFFKTAAANLLDYIIIQK